MITFTAVAAVPPPPRHADARPARDTAGLLADVAPLPAPLLSAAGAASASFHLRDDGVAGARVAAAATAFEGSSPCRWAAGEARGTASDESGRSTPSITKPEPASARELALLSALRELATAPVLTSCDYPSPGDLMEAP